MKRLFIYCLLLVSTSISAFEVDRLVTPNIISVGDTVDYKILITYSDQESLLTIPVAADFIPFELKDSSIEKRKDGNTWFVTLNYTLSLFSIENFTVPTQNIKYKSNNHFSSELLPPYAMTFKSLLKTDEKGQFNIEDVTNPYELYIEWNRYIVPGSIVFIVLLILIGSIWYYLKRRHVHRVIDHLDPEDEKSALEVALERFNSISVSMVKDDESLKMFYLLLSDITKHYLGSKYNKHIPEMTTSEALAFIHKELGEAFAKKLNTILSQSDLVKFAQFHPSEASNQELLNKAITFVKTVDEKLEEATDEVH